MLETTFPRLSIRTFVMDLSCPPACTRPTTMALRRSEMSVDPSAKVTSRACLPLHSIYRKHLILPSENIAIPTPTIPQCASRGLQTCAKSMWCQGNQLVDPSCQREHLRGAAPGSSASHCRSVSPSRRRADFLLVKFNTPQSDRTH